MSSCSSWNTLEGMAVAQASLPSLTFCVQATGRQPSRRSLVFYPNSSSSSSSRLSFKGPSILKTNRPWRFSRISAMVQGSRVTKVTSKELDAILDGTRDCPVVVDFYATWCGPCILLSEELDQLATEYGEAVKFLKVDTDEEHELASEMKIQGLPTLIFVSKDTNKNAIRTEGLLPADVIRSIIENEL